jgi:hypothetical protein
MQNMIKHILKQRKKPLVSVTLRDNDSGVLGFLVTYIFSHLAKDLSFLAKKLAKQTFLVPEQQNFVSTSQRTNHTHTKISWCCHLYEDYNERIYSSLFIWRPLYVQYKLFHLLLKGREVLLLKQLLLHNLWHCWYYTPSAAGAVAACTAAVE